MLFAYCWMWPNQQVLLWGIIPFKMKYLGWFELALWLLQFITSNFANRVSLVLGMAGFVAFFGPEIFSWCRKPSWATSAAGTGTTATTPGTDNPAA